MDQNPREGRHVELAELQRPEQGGTYRDAAAAIRRRRGLAIDRVGSSILVALVLVGVLALVSGESIGEQGLGVAIICVAALLLVKEVLYALRTESLPEAPPTVAPTGESDD